MMAGEKSLGKQVDKGQTRRRVSTVVGQVRAVTDLGDFACDLVIESTVETSELTCSELDRVPHAAILATSPCAAGGRDGDGAADPGSLLAAPMMPLVEVCVASRREGPSDGRGPLRVLRPVLVRDQAGFIVGTLLSPI
jgi:hypothetical protein